jgi:protein phosphatase
MQNEGVMNYSWASATHIGHVRETNEDTVFPHEDGSGPGPVVIAVADGMGGAAAGEIASGLAVAAATAAPPSDQDLSKRITAGNQAVLDAVERDQGLVGMGTTLTMVVLDAEGVAHFGHVGDSRAYLLRGESLRQLTHDHTYVMELVAKGQISPDDAETHPRRHLLTRVIGMDHVTVDSFDEPLEPGDRLMLCSDGLTGMVDDASIATLLREAASPAEAAWALVEAANAGGGVDNTTVAVVDVLPA